jgi:uncharacterized membrane protein (UPF0136 family)
MLIILLYALLVGGGGIAGYMAAHSLPSLIAGCASLLLLISCAFIIRVRPQAGYWAALATACLLDAFFSYRFLSSLRFFPSGFMALSSLAFIGYLVLQIRRRPA